MITAAAECRALASVVAVIAVVGVTSSLAGVADHVAAAALLVAAAGWAVVSVIRRELRIRRRIADTTGTRSAELWASGSRAGPGEHAPVPSVPHQPDLACHTGQLDAGRSDVARAVPQCPSMTSTVRGGTTP